MKENTIESTLRAKFLDVQTVLSPVGIMEEPVQVPERVLDEINHTVSLFHSCTKKVKSEVKSEVRSEVVSGETSSKDFVEHVEEQRALFLQGCIAHVYFYIFAMLIIISHALLIFLH